jgi:macrodomain Ter protein organizer (MatP/YcbG family)
MKREELGEVTAIRLSEKQRDRLSAEAKAQGRTLSAHIRAILDEEEGRERLFEMLLDLAKRFEGIEGQVSLLTKQVRKLRQEFETSAGE